MDARPVECAGIERSFGRRRALAGVDLEVGPGEVVGLVGPNGSGKTTLLKILSGFLRPDAGSARVFGVDPYADQARVMRRTRFAFAPPALFDSLTAREHLRYLTSLGGGRKIARDELERALATVGLADRADDRVRGFSFGMRQRLAVAQALLPRPELLVLDEPTDGLDPLAVLELRAIIAGLRTEHGIAVLLSSHLLVEIEELVDRMLVLSEGRAVFSGAPAELLDGRRWLRLGVDRPDEARAALAKHGHEARVDGNGELELAADALALAEASRLLAAEGLALASYHERRPTLEEALLDVMRAERGER